MLTPITVTSSQKKVQKWLTASGKLAWGFVEPCTFFLPIIQTVGKTKLLLSWLFVLPNSFDWTWVCLSLIMHAEHCLNFGEKNTTVFYVNSIQALIVFPKTNICHNHHFHMLLFLSFHAWSNITTKIHLTNCAGKGSCSIGVILISLLLH